MNRFTMMIAVAAVCCSAAVAEAQWVTTYYRAPTTVYYAPAPAVARTAYYAPAPQAVYYAPAAQVVRYAPVPAPAPVAVAPVYTTYYRPLLGGSITRVRYAPVAYAAPAATVAYYPAW